MPEYLRPLEVAALLRLHPITVYRRIAEGSIPAHRLGRALLIVRSELEAAIPMLPVQVEERRERSSAV